MLAITDRRGAMLVRGVSHNVVDPHQTLGPLVVDHPAPPAQLDSDTRRPVRAVRVVVDVTDLFDQTGLLELSNGGDPVTVGFPVVIRRPRHPRHLTDALYREPCGLLVVDEAVEHHSFDSFTQKATARFKSSRSIRNRAFSRRNSDSSRRSSVVRPWRSPRSISSCLTQLPNVES